MSNSANAGGSFGRAPTLCLCPSLCPAAAPCMLSGDSFFFFFVTNPFSASEGDETGYVQLCHGFVESELMSHRRCQCKTLASACDCWRDAMGGLPRAGCGRAWHRLLASHQCSRCLESRGVVVSRLGTGEICQVHRAEHILC